MALSKSGKTGSNVTQLDAVRKQRSTKKTSKTNPCTASTKKQPTQPTAKSAAGGKSKTTPAKSKASPKQTEEETEKDRGATTHISKKAEKAECVEKTAAKPRVSNRRFDTEKVERIKAAIADGRYEINYLLVADKFIEHERYA